MMSSLANVPMPPEPRRSDCVLSDELACYFASVESELTIWSNVLTTQRGDVNFVEPYCVSPKRADMQVRSIMDASRSAFGFAYLLRRPAYRIVTKFKRPKPKLAVVGKWEGS